MEKPHMQLLYDVPISKVDDDLYQRTALAKRCAHVLKSIQSDRAFVLGLSGPWGSGKSSLLMLVKQELLSTMPKSVIVEFNPWMFESHEQLIREYFGQLKVALGAGYDDNKLGKLLTEYSEAIAEGGVAALSLAIPQLAALNAAIPFANSLESFVIRRVLQKAGDRIGGREKTIAQLKSDICTILAQRTENVIVIIDDVDRLESKEIRALFKLVNNTASFPKITYLLSYDHRVVTAALSDVQGVDGDLFLEKIVQLPIELPPLSREDVRSQLSLRLDPYLMSQQTFRIEGSERSRLLHVFEKFVLEPISTPRQIKRYLNKLEATIAVTGNEICPIDVVGMVGLILFYPSTARWLMEHRYDICSGDSIAFRRDESYYSRLSPSLSKVLENDLQDSGVEEAVAALGLIFPKIKLLGSNLASSQSISISRETGRVANLVNFEHFLGHIDDSTASIPREYLYQLMTVSDVDSLAEGLVEIDSKGQLGRFCELAQTEKSTLGGRAEDICSAILQAVGKLRQDEEDALLRWSAMHKLSVLLSDLLRDIGADRADAIVSKAADGFSVQDYIGLGWFLRDERLAHVDNQRDKCLSDSVYGHLSRCYVKTMVDNWPEIVRMSHLHTRFLWHAIDDDSGGDFLKGAQLRYGADTVVRVLSMACELSHWYSSSGDGFSIGGPSERSDEPLMGTPTAREVESYGKSSDFKTLPTDIKIRVAALFILLSEYEVGFNNHEESRATSDDAARILEEWLL